MIPKLQPKFFKFQSKCSLNYHIFLILRYPNPFSIKSFLLSLGQCIASFFFPSLLHSIFRTFQSFLIQKWEKISPFRSNFKALWSNHIKIKSSQNPTSEFQMVEISNFPLNKSLFIPINKDSLHSFEEAFPSPPPTHENNHFYSYNFRFL